MDTLNKSVNPAQGFIVNQRALKRGQGDDLSLRRILNVIGKHKPTLIFTVLVVAGLAYLALTMVSPKYTSEATVLVQGQGPNLVTFDEVVRPVSVDPESLQSQVEIIRSREQVLGAIAALGLYKDPEFLKLSNPLPFLPQSEQRNVRPFEVSENGKKVRIPAQVYHYFQKHLKVSRQPKSRVISIGFTSKNPQTAADVVNTLADRYVQSTLDRKLKGIGYARVLLEKEVASLKQKVLESEQAVQRFKLDNGLTESLGQGLLAKQISEINSQLLLVRAERVEAQARYELLGRKGPGAEGRVSLQALGSPIIQKLREEELGLKRQLADLGEEYGPRHPKILALKAQMAGVVDSISAEARRIVKSVRDELSVKAARETSLEQSLASLRSRINLGSEKKVELEALEREADSNRQVLQAFLSRVKQTSAKSDPAFYKPDATIISKGFPAFQSSIPKPLPVLILATIAGFLLGLIMVFLKDSIDNSPSLEDEALEDRGAGEQTTFGAGNQSSENVVPMRARVPEPAAGVSAFMAEQGIAQPFSPKGRGGVVNVVGTIPLQGTGFGERVANASYVDDHKESAYSQALLMGMSAFFGDNQVSSIMITGADRSMARTSIAVSAAALLAKTGQKIILLDADLARPSLNLAFDEHNPFGLVDYLEKKRSLDSLVREDPRTRLHYLPAGECRVAPAGRFNLEVIRSVINQLGNEYDMVVVIGGPFLVSSDAKALGERTDRLIYVLPEKLRQNNKVLAEIIKVAKSRSQDAGVVYTG